MDNNYVSDYILTIWPYIWSFMIAEIDELKDTCRQKHNNLSAPPLRVKTKFDQTAPMENIYMYVNFIYVCYSMYVR